MSHCSVKKSNQTFIHWTNRWSLKDFKMIEDEESWNRRCHFFFCCAGQHDKNHVCSKLYERRWMRSVKNSLESFFITEFIRSNNQDILRVLSRSRCWIIRCGLGSHSPSASAEEESQSDSHKKGLWCFSVLVRHPHPVRHQIRRCHPSRRPHQRLGALFPLCSGHLRMAHDNVSGAIKRPMQNLPATTMLWVLSLSVKARPHMLFSFLLPGIKMEGSSQSAFYRFDRNTRGQLLRLQCRRNGRALWESWLRDSVLHLSCRHRRTSLPCCSWSWEEDHSDLNTRDDVP